MEERERGLDEDGASLSEHAKQLRIWKGLRSGKERESSCSGPTILGPGDLFHIRQSIQSCSIATFLIERKYAGLDLPVIFSHEGSSSLMASYNYRLPT